MPFNKISDIPLGYSNFYALLPKGETNFSYITSLEECLKYLPENDIGEDSSSNIEENILIYRDWLHVWKLARENGKIEIVSNLNCENNPDFNDMLEKEGQAIIDRNGALKHDLQRFREQLITASPRSKLFNFFPSGQVYTENTINRSKNGKLVLDPGSINEPIFVLCTEAVNSCNLSQGISIGLNHGDYNIQKFLKIDNVVKSNQSNSKLDLWSPNQESADPVEITGLIATGIYNIAREEDRNQRIYGKNLVFLARGLIRYTKTDLKGEKKSHLAPPVPSSS
jgi:hypothetical protein